MKYRGGIPAKRFAAGLLPILVVICIDFSSLPSGAQTQTQSPLSQALGASEAQAISTTTNVVTQGISDATVQALSPRPSKKQGSLAPPPLNTSSGKTQGPTGSAAQESPIEWPPILTVSPKTLALHDARRTLFAQAGDNRLGLEAPKKMCFLDRTDALQEKIYARMSSLTEKRRDQVVLGVFLDCAMFMSPDDWLDGMPDVGIVSWLNPAIGATTPMPRRDYLDMREASFAQYVEKMAPGLKLDKTVHRNKNNVSLAMAGEEAGQEGIKHKTTVILSTTVVRQVPIEITLHYADSKLPDFKEAYAVMDKLMAQQIVLNEQNKPRKNTCDSSYCP